MKSTVNLGPKICHSTGHHYFNGSYENQNRKGRHPLDRRKNQFSCLTSELALKNYNSHHAAPLKFNMNKLACESEGSNCHSDTLALAIYGIAKLPFVKQTDQPNFAQKLNAALENVAGSTNQKLHTMIKLCHLLALVLYVSATLPPYHTNSWPKHHAELACD